MVTKKIGRPKSDNPKNIQTRVRMTKEEALMLQECADFFEKPKSEIIVTGIRKVYADIKK